MKNYLGKPSKILGIYHQYFASHTAVLFVFAFDNIIKERAMMMNIWLLLISGKNYLNLKIIGTHQNCKLAVMSGITVTPNTEFQKHKEITDQLLFITIPELCCPLLQEYFCQFVGKAFKTNTPG